MPDTDYNGWTNRETWVVNLWVTSNYDAYKMMQGKDLSTPALCKWFVMDAIPSNVWQGIKADLGLKSRSDFATFPRKVNWEELCEAWNEE